jgi:hypothetical protein
MKNISIVALLLSASLAFAQGNVRAWTGYTIPNATCGNGDAYKIFISPGTSSKVALAFQDGGACWSHDSCFGVIKTASLKAPTSVDITTGIYSMSSDKSPAANSTMIYFPYCTGDVFAGMHVAQYGVRHMGGENVRAAISYLVTNHWSIFNKATDLLVYGASAGALGALTHSSEIDKAFGAIPKKTMILDSPGLHFGPTFWHKFSPELVKDYSVALSSVGLKFDYDNGLIASVVPAICATLRDWRIGVLQGTRDRVMSFVFGNISMADHEKLVLGEGGIFELTKDPDDNCSAWVPSTSQHTFIDTNKDGPSINGVTAMDFAFELAGSSRLKNYKN